MLVSIADEECAPNSAKFVSCFRFVNAVNIIWTNTNHNGHRVWGVMEQMNKTGEKVRYLMVKVEKWKVCDLVN